MRKLIAILEHDAARVDLMTSWLDDRLYMYDRSFSDDLPSLLEVISTRLKDLIVLSLGRESMIRSELGIDGAWAVLADCILMAPDRFPILVSADSTTESDSATQALIQNGWTIKRLVSDQSPKWVNDVWFPTLSKSLRGRMEPRPPVSDRLVDSGSQSG